MPIPVACSGCGKHFHAPDRGAGKKVPCPSCKTTILIPAHVVVDDDEEYRLAEEAAPEPRPQPTFPSPRPSLPAAATPHSHPAGLATTAPAVPNRQTVYQAPPVLPGANAAAPSAGWVPPTKSSTPTWLRHLHWCLALAMIPLAVSIFLPDESPDELIQRLMRSVASAKGEIGLAGDNSDSSQAGNDQIDSPDEAANPEVDTSSDEAALEELLGETSLDDLLLTLPGRKLEGAFLARDSFLHWLFAIVSVAAYMTFFVYLATDHSAKSLHLLGLGTFTATIGILLLLVVQVLASIGLIGGRGIVGLILFILALIGLSYSAALDPDTGFFVSFLGFTCGVGLCEELVKALPILVFYKIGTKQNWRGAFLWGLASGAGFGVAEGIMYSQDFYNGITGPGIYVVRFVSCVALHAVWSGSVGISINQRQYLLDIEMENWFMYAVAVLRMIAIPMVLHGLYDTLLKKDLAILALLTAAASFGYLAWQIYRLRTSDDEDERAVQVAQYIRSKVLAGQQA